MSSKVHIITTVSFRRLEASGIFPLGGVEGGGGGREGRTWGILKRGGALEDN